MSGLRFVRIFLLSLRQTQYMTYTSWLSLTPGMQVACVSETLVPVYQIYLRHIYENHFLLLNTTC